MINSILMNAITAGEYVPHLHEILTGTVHNMYA